MLHLSGRQAFVQPEICFKKKKKKKEIKEKEKKKRKKERRRSRRQKSDMLRRRKSDMLTVLSCHRSPFNTQPTLLPVSQIFAQPIILVARHLWLCNMDIRNLCHGYNSCQEWCSDWLSTSEMKVGKMNWKLSPESGSVGKLDFSWNRFSIITDHSLRIFMRWGHQGNWNQKWGWV